GDEPLLKLKVVVGNHHVARVTHNVNDLPIAWIKILVALDDARPRRLRELPSGYGRRVRNFVLDVGKGYHTVTKNQVGNQKPRPSVAGSRIGNDEGIIRKHWEVAAASVQT